MDLCRAVEVESLQLGVMQRNDSTGWLRESSGRLDVDRSRGRVVRL